MAMQKDAEDTKAEAEEEAEARETEREFIGIISATTIRAADASERNVGSFTNIAMKMEHGMPLLHRTARKREKMGNERQ